MLCFGAAAAKDRLDVIVQDAINAGDIPGPRCLANAREIAKPDGELVAGTTRFADGPQDNEIIACVDEAHKRVCAHARAKDSAKMYVKHGVDVIYHGSYVDDEAVEKAGYKRELDIAVAGLRELHREIVVLPGGDYDFAWTPHRTYARDLEHFVKMLGFTPHKSIIAVTVGLAALMMRGHQFGKVQPGYYADRILVDGGPLQDISIHQDHDKLNIIIMNGRVHKARKEYIRDMSGSLSTGIPRHLTEEFPEKRPAMQKSN
ncbi:hypothetical protein N0V84_003602 [Fusarium piperis]|uniref:Amidohydrolase-related domain-containing protein n=1 Tax=Fusarium piperis TaxID=1435070 RepID=A0A9W8WH46_9HYPO|nr:hypothetical protein N0V84_003602 [Fusarium piperis]